MLPSSPPSPTTRAHTTKGSEEVEALVQAKEKPQVGVTKVKDSMAKYLLDSQEVKRLTRILMEFEVLKTRMLHNWRVVSSLNRSRFKEEMTTVNLDRIQSWIDQGRINPSRPITLVELVKSGCVGRIADGVKLLARVGHLE